MRFFKNANSFKLRKTTNSEDAKEWVEGGWKECDRHGVLLTKTKKAKKVDKK